MTTTSGSEKSIKKVSLLEKILSKPYDPQRHQGKIAKQDELDRMKNQWLSITAQTGLSKHDAQFKTWEYLKIDCKELADCVAMVKAWCPDDETGLFLYGEPGNGKSHMMKSLILDHWSPSREFQFLNVSSLMIQLKDWETKEYCFQRLSRPFGLVLDDLGTEKGSEFEQEQFFRLLEMRKDLRKPVFITSNLTLKQLTEKYSLRIVSRLGEMFTFVENKAPSFRKKIHAEKQRIMLERLKLV